MEQLNRRHFLQSSVALAGLGLIVGCGVLPFQAQPQSKVHRIGFLAPGSRDSQASTVNGLLQALGELGYVDGQNMVFDYRFGELEAHLPDLAAELVQLNVDLLLTNGTPAGLAAKHATSTIPIVILSSDPVGVGLVASLSRPGGNVTGLTNYIPQMTGKQLQLLLAALPSAGRIAYFVNPDNPTSAPQEQALLDTARTLPIQLIRLEARTVAAIASGFETTAVERADGLVVLADSLILSPQRSVLAELTLQSHIPAIFAERRAVALGGLLGYGPNLTDEFRARARYVDRLLRGAKPADLPVEGPTTFDFAVNLKTAQALGLTIPQSVLQQATEVIQ
jgi:putative ABC transport system substrate-binding protein